MYWQWIDHIIYNWQLVWSFKCLKVQIIMIRRNNFLGHKANQKHLENQIIDLWNHTISIFTYSCYFSFLQTCKSLNNNNHKSTVFASAIYLNSQEILLTNQSTNIIITTTTHQINHTFSPSILKEKTKLHNNINFILYILLYYVF